MRYKIVPVSVIICLLAVTELFSQQNPAEIKIPDILPPSPTSMELGRYGLVPMGLATGSANINIPLHTYTTKNLSVPISVSYNSSGVKVDQIATWVGMNMSLNCGGVITRIIRDEPDNESPSLPYPQDVSSINPEAVTYIEAAGEPNNGTDSERDIFAFNFLEYTGKFIFDRDGSPIVMPFQNLKIERIIETAQPEAGNGNFKITTPDGVVFTFGGSGATELSRVENGGQGCGRTRNFYHETSWYLIKIQHPQGDVIHFEYQPKSHYFYTAGVSQIVTKKAREENQCGIQSNCPDLSNNTCESIQHLQVVNISRIWSTNYGEIKFNASRDRLDLSDVKLNSITVKDPSGETTKSFSFLYTFSQATLEYANVHTIEQLRYRMFLTSLIEKNKLEVAEKKHVFEYEDMNGLPPRLSYSQDHWGYFNGAHNGYLVPRYLQGVDNVGRKLFDGIGGNREFNGEFVKKGILTKVIYPTGGNNELISQPNTYWGTKTIYPSKTDFNLSVTGTPPFGRDTKSRTIYSFAQQEIKFRLSAFRNTDAEGDPGHHQYVLYLTVKDETEGYFVFNSNNLVIGESISEYLTLKSNHQYTFSITAHGDMVKGTLLFDYYAEPLRDIETNIETGGLRIAQVISLDPVTGNREMINYHYSKLSSLSRSSGLTVNHPQYYSENTIRNLCTPREGGAPNVWCETFDCIYGCLNSSTQSTLYPFGGGNPVYYRYVTVSRGDNFQYGAEEHEFNITFDSPGSIVMGSHILNAPYTNFGWDNGLEKAVRSFKSGTTGDFVLLSEVNNNYVTDERNTRTVPSLLVKRRYDKMCPWETTIPCDASNVNAATYAITCTTNHNHIWALGLAGTLCIASGNHHESKLVWEHPCNTQNKAVGESIVLRYYLDNLDVVEYKSIAYWHYLKSTTETRYDQEGTNPITTTKEYFYENEKHGQLTRVRTTTSEDKLLENVMKYPEDYGNVENINVLKEKHLVNLVVKVENSVGGAQTEGKIVKYNDFGQPTAMYQFESQALQASAPHDPMVLIPPSNYRAKVNFQYDPVNHTIQEVTAPHLPKTAYLWGYAHTKVIAKVVGASANQLFYTSFEETGTTGSAKTGSHFFNSGSYLISTTDFSPPSTAGLKMSYWYWENNQWNFSGVIDFTRTINRGTKLDEIRVFPAGSEMTTLTYNLSADVSCTMDTNGIVTHYEYDNAGRLARVNDDKRNILKEYEYYYSHK